MNTYQSTRPAISFRDNICTHSYLYSCVSFCSLVSVSQKDLNYYCRAFLIRNSQVRMPIESPFWVPKTFIKKRLKKENKEKQIEKLSTPTKWRHNSSFIKIEEINCHCNTTALSSKFWYQIHGLKKQFETYASNPVL